MRSLPTDAHGTCAPAASESSAAALQKFASGKFHGLFRRSGTKRVDEQRDLLQLGKCVIVTAVNFTVRRPDFVEGLLLHVSSRTVGVEYVGAGGRLNSIVFASASYVAAPRTDPSSRRYGITRAKCLLFEITAQQCRRVALPRLSRSAGYPREEVEHERIAEESAGRYCVHGAVRPIGEADDRLLHATETHCASYELAVGPGKERSIGSL